MSDLNRFTSSQGATMPQDVARESLATIRKGWRHVLDPIRTSGGGATMRTERPATDDDLDLTPDARMDTPITLAFWVHAAIDQWPVTVQTLRPDEHGHQRLVTTATIDCSDVYAMVDYLDRHAERIATWTEPGHDYGATFVTELAALARAVARVAWPPKGDRMTIGECPACGRRIRVKAPSWRRVPHPTTDPDIYPAWSDWQPDRDRPVTCRCGAQDTLDGWRLRLAGPSLLLTAEQLVADIHTSLGMRYQALTVRTWARRSLITVAGYSHQGHAVYDRTQVLAALMVREAERERAS